MGLEVPSNRQVGSDTISCSKSVLAGGEYSVTVSVFIQSATSHMYSFERSVTSVALMVNT